MTNRNLCLTKWIGVVAGVALCTLVGTTPIQAQISIVVSATSSHGATESQVADIFVGAQTAWSDGTKILVVDQQDTDVGKNFYSEFIRQSLGQVRTQWTRLVLSGQVMAPKKVANGDAVKRALAENPGSIGYIATSTLDDSVKELVRIN
jgi:ABC-type phosphate transport system substrate-binding protein